MSSTTSTSDAEIRARIFLKSILMALIAPLLASHLRVNSARA